MKKYAKIIVAVMGITVAVFGSIKANAKIAGETGKCVSTSYICGQTDIGQNIVGVFERIPE